MANRKRQGGIHVDTDDPEEFGHTGMNLRRPDPIKAPVSWWLSQDREGFTQKAYQEVPRMRESKFANTDVLAQ